MTSLLVNMSAAMHLTVLVLLLVVTLCNGKPSTMVTPSTPPLQVTSTITSNSSAGTQPSPSTLTATPNQTTIQTTNHPIFHLTTLPTASGIPNNTTQNTTHPALPQEDGTDNLTSNPGLVAILCIFCIVASLMLVVATVKCMRSRRINFKRLHDVPMNNVNEESPIAHYSK